MALAAVFTCSTVGPSLAFSSLREFLISRIALPYGSTVDLSSLGAFGCPPSTILRYPWPLLLMNDSSFVRMLHSKLPRLYSQGIPRMTSAETPNGRTYTFRVYL